MAQPMFLNVPEGFDMGVFAQKMTDAWQQKGYIVQSAVTETTAVLTINKGLGGINTVLGLGEGVTANCSLADGRLIINFINEEWTSKIIACIVGWFCCFIPLVTGIVGIVRQINLPKNISADAQLYVTQSIGVPPVDEQF